MPIIVDLPDGTEAEFPDGMAPSDIESVIQKQFPNATESQGNRGLTWGEAASSAIDNIPSSFERMAVDIGTAAAHPLDTMQGMYSLMKGAGVLPIQLMSPATAADKANFLRFTKAMTDRYGSVENIKRTLASDPVGMLADISGIFTAAGGTIRAAGAIPKVPGMVGKVGKAMSTVGNTVDPINLALKQPIARGAGLLGGGALAEKMYMSALKPKPSNRALKAPEQRSAAFQTALDNDIKVSGKGAERARGLVMDNSDKVDDILKNEAAAGAAIDMESVIDRLDSLRSKPDTDMIGRGRVIDKKAGSFIDSHPEQIPVDVANEIKKNTYARLDKQYLKHGSVGVEAEKALARGIKEEIAAKFPEIAGLNADSAALITLQKAIDDALPRINNNNVISMDTAVKTIGGGQVGGTAGATATFLTNVLASNPKLKSALALALAKARKAPKYNMPKASPVAMGMVQGGRAEKYGR